MLTTRASTLKLAAAVSEDLVNAIIDGLRKNGIAYIRAPYEADGQLAYCALRHPRSIVWTCDSDLLVLGGPRVAMRTIGEQWRPQFCDLYEQTNILNPTIPVQATRDSPIVEGVDYSLALLIKIHGRDALMGYAGLAGCDYATIPGIGPKTAIKILQDLPVATAVM